MPKPLAVVPAAPLPAPAEVAERLDRHAREARGAFAPETERALRRASGAFTAWCADRGARPLPADPSTVAAYVDALAGEGRRPSGIRQAVWAVGRLHRAAGLADPAAAEPVRLALRRMGRVLGTRQRQAAPVGALTAERMLAFMDESPAGLRDAALLLAMRSALLRRAEAVELRAEDVEPLADGGATVLVRRSKTDQEGAGAAVYLTPHAALAVRRWLESAGIAEGPVFRRLSKAGRPLGPLSGASVASILKARAARAGLDPAAVSGHSCRVGMAQDLAADGAQGPAIMQAGRWRSPAMVARYTERIEAGRGAVAEYHRRRGGA